MRISVFCFDLLYHFVTDLWDLWDIPINPGRLFTKRTGVLPQDLAKFQWREIRV